MPPNYSVYSLTIVSKETCYIPMDIPKNIGQQNFLRYKLTSWCCKEKQNYGQDVNAGKAHLYDF